MGILKTLLEAGLSPFGIVSILLACGILTTVFRRRSRLGPRLITAGVALWFLIVFTPLAEVLVTALERPYPPLTAPEASGVRMILVLSSYGEQIPSFPPTSRLSEETMARLAEGIRLHRLLPGSRMILSGGVLRPGDAPIASMMAEFCTSLGVAETDILVEGVGRGTPMRISSKQIRSWVKRRFCW